MNDFENPDFAVLARPEGFREWEKSLAYPFDDYERRLAAAAWDAAWVAHAVWSAQARGSSRP